MAIFNRHELVEQLGSVRASVHMTAVHVAAAASVCLPIFKSGFSDVSAAVAKLFGQLVDDILENDGVNVLPHQVDEEPVAHVGLADHHFDALALDPSVPEPEHKGANVRAEDDHDPVDEDKEAQ